MRVRSLLALPLVAFITLATLSAPGTPTAQAAPAATVLDSPTGEVIASTVGPDGTAYTLGSFTRAGAATGGLARLNSSAAVQRNFPTVTGRVNALVSDGAGGWFLSGNFTAVGGQSRTMVAHVLSDGTVDPAWAPTVIGYSVNALQLVGSTLYLGGDFSSINGQSFSNLAAVNASNGQPLSWTPNPNFSVSSLVADDSALYVGGNFSSISSSTRNRIAAFDLTTRNLLSWDPNANGSVNAIAHDGSTVYVGGDFTMIGGQIRNRLAALPSASAGSSAATSWDPQPNSTVFALAVDDTVVYAGGAFTTVNGGTTRNRAAAFPIASSTATSWSPNLNDSVRRLLPSPGGVYVGGQFTTVNGATSREGLALVDQATGAVQPWDARLAAGFSSASVLAMSGSGSDLVIGGDFSHANTVTRNRAAAFDSQGLLTSWDPNLNNEAYAITVSGSTAYIVGNFTSVNGGTARNYAAAVRTDDTGTATTWNPNLNASAWSVAISNGFAYVGGIFTTVNGGTTRNYAAAFRTDDAGTATAWNPNLNGEVFDFAFEDDTAYMVGNFSSVGGTVRRFAAAVRTDDAGTVTAWNPNLDNQVRSLDKVGSIAYLGGRFTTVGGTSRSFAAAVRTDDTGTLTEWNPNIRCTGYMSCYSSGVSALDAQDGTVYIGGVFDTVGGVSNIRSLTAVSATGTGARQTAWATDFGGSSFQIPRLNTISATSSGVVVGGNFTQLTLTGLGSYPPLAARLPLVPTAPAAPTGVTATAGDAQASIAWTAGSDGGSAVTRVEFALDDTTAVDDSTTNTASPYTLTGLTNGQSYVVYVRLVNSVGPGDWSLASAPFTPQASTPPPNPPQPVFSPPGPPQQVMATPGNAEANVTWSPPADTGTYPIDGYVVRAQPGGQTCSTVTTTCTVASLTNGTAYTFTVTASSAAGTGSASQASAPVTPRTVPDAPTAVMAIPGIGEATVTWSAPSDDGGSAITGYRVMTLPASAGCQSTASTCTIRDLTAGREYVVTVVAVNAAGESAPSQPVTVTPRERPVIVITGTRTGKDDALIRVKGEIRGMEVATVQPFYRLAKQRSFRSSASPVPVTNGSFTWQRMTSKKVAVYVEAGDQRSNTVTIPAR